MISTTRLEQYAADPSAFRADLLIDCNGVVKRLGDVLEPWQDTDYRAIDPGLLRCAGRVVPKKKTKKRSLPTLMRVFLERSRGHDKTTSLAVTCAYALAFSTRPLKGYCYAADADQAGLLKAAMATLIRLNPWLAEILEVQKGVVVNITKGHPGEGGSLKIEASDVGSSYGILPDLIIADEVCHWPEAGDGLFHSLISSAAKRDSCLFVIITNSGFADSWQWTVREAARTDPDTWYFSRLDGVVASWISPKALEEQQRMLPPMAYARLWLNQWTSGLGDAISEEAIDRAFNGTLGPMTGKEAGYLFVAGVDLGLTRDHTAVVVLGVEKASGRIRLAHHKRWAPLPGKKVDLLEVERYLRYLDEKFDLDRIAFDPWQADLLARRLEHDHRSRSQRRRLWVQPFMREVPPTAANLRDIAGIVIEAFNDGALQLFPCPQLRSDLSRLRAEELKTGGFRLVSPRNGSGHGDSASAFGIALLVAHEESGRKKVSAGFVGGSTPLSDWEARQAAYAREMEAMRQPDDGEDWFADLMQLRKGLSNQGD